MDDMEIGAAQEWMLENFFWFFYMLTFRNLNTEIQPTPKSCEGLRQKIDNVQHFYLWFI
jgi:hypothetical protein